MKKETIYLLGALMIGVGLLSTLHFTFVFQGLFQTHLARYGALFDKGRVGHCLYMDVMMFLYIASFLFKNLYYVIGGILVLCLAEFGRELGLLASFIALITEVSLRLVNLASGSSEATPFFIGNLVFFFISIAIPTLFIFFLTRKPIMEYLKK